MNWIKGRLWRRPYLEPEVLELALNVLRQHITGYLVAYLKGLGLHLEPVAVFLKFALEKIDMGIKIGLEGI